MSHKLFRRVLVLVSILGAPLFAQAQLVHMSENTDTPVPNVTLPTGNDGVLVELCAAIDGSGSIPGADFMLQTEGLAQAVENPAVVPQSGIVSISVVQFGDNVTVEVFPTVIDSQATADAAAAMIRAIVQDGGLTDMGGAIVECSGLFVDPDSTWIIDISTDGEPTMGPDPITARDNAVAVGLDTLNALGVGPFLNIPFLEELVWPQPASIPFEPGFVIIVPDFATYVTAIQEKTAGEVPLEVAFDVKPGSCPNPLNFKSRGVLPVAILGTEDFEVTDIDVSTVELEGVAPIRSSVDYVAAPYEPFIGKESCDECTEENDMYMDLALKFDKQAIVAALGDQEDRSCVVLHLTGELFDGRTIVGEDVVIVLNK